MTAGEMIELLEGYDANADVEVEMRFAEAGEACAATFDVTVGSRDEAESGAQNDWPTIAASVGFGTMATEELELVIDCVKGIDRRLNYDKVRVGLCPRKCPHPPSQERFCNLLTTRQIMSRFAKWEGLAADEELTDASPSLNCTM